MVIERDQPILAICLYHAPNDIWRIPLLVQEMLPQHRFSCAPMRAMDFRQCSTLFRKKGYFLEGLPLRRNVFKSLRMPFSSQNVTTTVSPVECIVTEHSFPGDPHFAEYRHTSRQ
jgi:hypothetical protein